MVSPAGVRREAPGGLFHRNASRETGSTALRVNLNDVRERLRRNPSTRRLLELAGRNAPGIHVRGLTGSLPAIVLSLVPRSPENPLVILCPSDEDAEYMRSDLHQLVNDARRFPPSDNRPYDPDHLPDTSRLVERAEILDALHLRSVELLVTSADALHERLPARSEIEDRTIRVERGESHDPDELVARMIDLGFTHVDFAEEPGDLAVRGGIVDAFPFAGGFPIRIEFFGDEIESIREFDPTSQRSVSDKPVVRLFANLESRTQVAVNRETLLQLLPGSSTVAVVNPRDFMGRVDGLINAQREAFSARKRAESTEDGHGPDAPIDPPQRLFASADELRAELERFGPIQLGTPPDTKPGADITTEPLEFRSSPQPDFHGHLDLVRSKIAETTEDAWSTVVLCDSRTQRSRLEELLERELAGGRVSLELASIHQGFELPDERVRVYTDHQIFNRYHRPSTRKATYAKAGLSLRDIRSLKPGDFVVHVDHGIGRFAGMRRIEVRDRIQEAACLKYRDDDTLFVNVNALHKLNKYKGKEGTQPSLTKLGSGQWERTKARTSKRVKDIARDLIKLYAQRQAADGFAFTPDTTWQREMEASFEFEDTPDQYEASVAVKEDMAKPVPMDRLVCGDVGFGKTEIAIRAAFKAVQDGKQVAVLVPTTVLAAQHFDTFRRRLTDYPVRTAMLSRFVSAAEQKETLSQVAAGEVDILIGTHRVVSKDVAFRNLGLMIVDEEQRFGVSVKEKLRAMRVNVDTLTLTATPIPRTLQFSLLGARDLSIIGTPPPNRQPILTEIHAYSSDLIRDAIRYELGRGGQVFFIHNRVRSIEEMSASLRALVPDARLQVAHGQMRAAQLERVMIGFKQHDFDVLVSTNIIENGLDIANANTIIINQANRFGLSELHQIRGRVGRSDRKAFCYLLVPAIHGLTREARQRLTAIEEFSDLGSGFSIAMRDLDIRGAGNMLGAEQSGFIADVGFETYHRILDDAVRELREEEFSELFADRPRPRPLVEASVEIDADALIPADYLNQETERLNVYRRISEARTVEALNEIKDELDDRFGTRPPEVDNLLVASRLRIIAEHVGLTKVVYKNNRLFLTCPKEDDYPVFYDTTFRELLERLEALANRFVIRETKAKRVQAIVQEVATMGMAEAIMVELAGIREDAARGSTGVGARASARTSEGSP